MGEMGLDEMGKLMQVTTLLPVFLTLLCQRHNSMEGYLYPTSLCLCSLLSFFFFSS